MFQPPSDLADAFAAVYRRVLPDSPYHRAAGVRGMDAYSAILTKTADGIRQAGAFGDPQQWRFDWDRPCTREEWLDVVPTSGTHTQLPPAKLQEILAGLGAAIDAVGGSFTMHYTAVATTAARTSVA